MLINNFEVIKKDDTLYVNFEDVNFEFWDYDNFDDQIIKINNNEFIKLEYLINKISDEIIFMMNNNYMGNKNNYIKMSYNYLGILLNLILNYNN